MGSELRVAGGASVIPALDALVERRPLPTVRIPRGSAEWFLLCRGIDDEATPEARRRWRRESCFAKAEGRTKNETKTSLCLVVTVARPLTPTEE